MDKYPLLWQGKSAGELTVTEEGLYTCFDCACRLPGEGIWCAWAVGADGQLRLGVLEPEGRRGRIRRRFSRQMTAPLGKLLRGEVRPAAEGAEDWAPLDMGKEPLRTPWLQKALAGTAGVLTRREGERRWLAVPWDCGKPFPLVPMVCFASLRRIRARDYAVFLLHGQERPQLP